MAETNNNIVQCENEEAFVLFTAEYLIKYFQDCIKEKNEIIIAISGGSTPIPIFEYFVRHYHSTIDWNSVIVYWVDERCVSPDDEQSNFKHAFNKFIKPLGISNFTRIKGEKSPQIAAREYEELFAEKNIIFDLVWLGMGTDGHTASLFPSTSILNEEKKLISEVFVQKLNSWRISLTYPCILQAKKRLISFKGERKIAVFDEIKKGAKEYPMTKIYNFGINNDFIILK